MFLYPLAFLCLFLRIGLDDKLLFCKSKLVFKNIFIYGGGRLEREKIAFEIIGL